MLRALIPLIVIGMLVFCLIDCVQTEPSRIRNLPKVVWILLIIILPFGGIAWLIAGRPERGTPPRATGFPPRERPSAPRGPDDDPDFLRQMGSIDAEHEKTLKQWEEDLRARERKMRDEGGADGPQDDPPAPQG